MLLTMCAPGLLDEQVLAWPLVVPEPLLLRSPKASLIYDCLLSWTVVPVT